MNNHLLILQTLDRHLDRPVELTLCGRAMPAIRELHGAFRAAQPKVLELARRLNSNS